MLARRSPPVTRHDLGREEFLAEVWKWRTAYGGRIVDQLRSVGVSLDWSQEFFTLDEARTEAVVEAFVRLHEAGLVSAVYFVSDGDPALVAVSSPPQGQLIFRGGPQPPQWKAERADSATHTYLAIPPTPGTLVCFPGSVPHCVFPLSPDLPLSRKFEVQPRISFAMNFRVQAPQPERLPVPPETAREPSRIHHGIPQGATTLL